ncbi:MAG: HTH domain-containing protein [Candidatus Aenigmarchaeota archaeon]|nr:HTH domain-containing protein [Candidatus Aenigmarchaeota archaeon]
MREFHITSFPGNVYILLDKEFRKYFIDSAIERLGNKTNVAKFLEITRTTFCDWIKCKRIRKGKLRISYMPLWAIIKLITLLKNQHMFSIENIEKHIVAYRLHGENPIFKPKLPIKETPELIGITCHLFGDRSGGDEKGHRTVTKNDIIRILSEKNPLTAKDIGYRLNISPSTIRDFHLQYLKKLDKVKIVGKNEFGSYLWSLN